MFIKQRYNYDCVRKNQFQDVYVCMYVCMKHSQFLINTVRPMLRQLQTFATLPYITATTEEMKTSPRSSTLQNIAAILTRKHA